RHSNAPTAANPKAVIAPPCSSRPATNAIRGSAAGASLVRTLEGSESLHVMRVGKQIEEVERGEAPTRRGQPVRVAGEDYRIAGEITNHLARLFGDRADDFLARTGARRIEEDEVGFRNCVAFDRRVRSEERRVGKECRGRCRPR